MNVLNMQKWLKLCLWPVLLPACWVDLAVIVEPVLDVCCHCQQLIDSLYLLWGLPWVFKCTVTVKPNDTNFRAGTAPAGGRCRTHSFLQKMDDTRTAAAEAQRGRGCERTPPWYCIKVLETREKTLLAIHLQRVQRQIHPVALSTGGKKRWSACGSGGKRNF